MTDSRALAAELSLIHVGAGVEVHSLVASSVPIQAGQLVYATERKSLVTLLSRALPDSICLVVSESSKDLLPEGLSAMLVKTGQLKEILYHLCQKFDNEKPLPAGVHPSAFVDPSARLGEEVSLGPFVYVGPHVSLARGVSIESHASLQEGVSVGEFTRIRTGARIAGRATIGARCTIGPNTAIGFPGFGLASIKGGSPFPRRIPHLASVRLGDEVEIGAGTCIDRGLLSDTILGDGVKVDNQCHIAHNVQIGRGAIIAGQCAIAGSAKIGEFVMFGGRVTCSDHVTIGSGASVVGTSVLVGHYEGGQRYSSHWVALPWRKWMAQVSFLKKQTQPKESSS